MIKIAILQRGWVYIGEFSQEGEMCTLTNAFNIRRWGTSEGLGELAEKGKQPDTKLDKTGKVEFHILTSIALLDVNEEIWKKELE